MKLHTLYRTSLFFLGFTLCILLPFYVARDSSTLYYGYDEFGPMEVKSKVLVSSSSEITDYNNTITQTLWSNESTPLLFPCGQSTWSLDQISSFYSLSSSAYCYTNSSFLSCTPTPFEQECTPNNEVVTLYSADVWLTSHLYYYAISHIVLNYRFTSQGRIRDSVDITEFDLLVDLDMDYNAIAFKKGDLITLFPSASYSITDFNISLEPFNIWLYITQDYEVLDARNDYPYRDIAHNLSITFWTFLMFSLSFTLASVVIHQI